MLRVMMTTSVLFLAVVIAIASLDKVTLGGLTNESDTLDTAGKNRTFDRTQYEEKIPTLSDLLELMLKISAQPDQWNKINKLLRNIEDDLITSRDVIRRLETATDELEGINRKINRKKTNLTAISTKNHRRKDEKHRTRNTSRTREPNRTLQRNSSSIVKEKQWPVFGSSSDRSVQFLNIRKDNSDRNDENQLRTDNKLMKSPYQKNFAYHRVTGTPMNQNNPPKAYMAVSVPDPQPRVYSSSNEEDAILEDELHKLKPWKP